MNTQSNQPNGSTKDDTKAGQYLTFILNGQTYGIPIGKIREIDRVGEITPVPQTPIYVAGVMNLRGKVIPVIDLRLKFGFEDTPHTRQTCIIVIEGLSGEFGAIVDGVSGVMGFLSTQIEPAPSLGSDSRLGFITGMAKTDNSENVVILVNILEVFNKDPALPENKNEAA